MNNFWKRITRLRSGWGMSLCMLRTQSCEHRVEFSREACHVYHWKWKFIANLCRDNVAQIRQVWLQNSTRIISHVACALDYIFDIKSILGFPRHVITIMNRLRWVGLGLWPHIVEMRSVRLAAKKQNFGIQPLAIWDHSSFPQLDCMFFSQNKVWIL